MSTSLDGFVAASSSILILLSIVMTSTPAAGVINSRPVGVVEPIPPPSVTSSTRPTPSKKKSQPFWLGGAASMGAACFSHPLDLLKVRLQCSTTAKPPGSETAPAMRLWI